MASILALLLAFAPQDDSRISEIQGRLQRVEQDVDRQRALLEQELGRPNTTCTAEMRLFVKPQERIQSPSRTLAPDARIEAGVSTAVSTPTGHCLPGQIIARATYFDANNSFICSGSVLAAPQNEHTQVTLLEIHPWRTREFVLWRNGPPRSLPAEMLCRDANGAVVLEPWEARTLRVQITALGRNGGVASAEFDVLLEVASQ